MARLPRTPGGRPGSPLRQVRVCQRNGTLRDVVADLGPEPSIPLELKEAVYRIGREAMHNTAKHARASTIHVHLRHEDGEISLRITDNGQGFETGGEFPGHLGLKSMTERARNLGGTLHIESQPGSGTEVRPTVPAGRAVSSGAG